MARIIPTGLHFMVLLLPLLGLPWAPARAAQGYDSCTGYIDTLPATISTQGTWCLRGHKFTSQVSGAAITVQTDNVTVDCNHFRLSGLGAGAATNAIGITAGASRLNATVRRCRVQGFKYGVVMYGAHHMIEHSRFELNTHVGIFAAGDQHVIAHNEVMLTGGRPAAGVAYGIYAQGPGMRVSHNTVDGVSALADAAGSGTAWGISASGVIEFNYIANMQPSGPGTVVGILGIAFPVVRGNSLVQTATTPGRGIVLAGVCRDNNIFNFVTAIEGDCVLAGDNYARVGM